MFERKESAWVEGDVLPVPEAKVEDPFGISMAADGATIVVGAQFAHDRATNAGLAYVLERRSDGIKPGPCRLAMRQLVISSASRFP